MKNILVVGCNGGMGKAICTHLVQKQFAVVGIDIHETPAVDNITYFCGDVRDFDGLQAIFEQLKEAQTTLQAVVCTSGIYRMNSLLEISESDYQNIFDINFFGVYRVNKIFAPLMTKGSRFVITSSELAPLNPLPFTGLYGITKSVLEKYAFSLRMEVSLLGMHVSIIRPGAVKTQLLDDTMANINAFCDNTQLYAENSRKFLGIVNAVESKHVKPERVAKLVAKAVCAKKPKYVYNLNRNFGLRLLSCLSPRMQVGIITGLLKGKKSKQK